MLLLRENFNAMGKCNREVVEIMRCKVQMSSRCKFWQNMAIHSPCKFEKYLFEHLK